MKPKRLFKRFLPQSLLGRSLVILVTPLIVVQVVLSYMFFGRHTDTVLDLLAENIAGDVQMVNDLLDNNYSLNDVTLLADKNLYLKVDFSPGLKIDQFGAHKQRWLHQYLIEAFDDKLDAPYFFRIDSNQVVINVQRADGVLNVSLPRKRFFSRTTPLVVIWTTISAVLLFIVASLFMRNQIRPIRRLAEVAERFGKGERVDSFRPEGATEVRKAGLVFNVMRERLSRQLRERTEMLAGVSHDLRTPLTRMRLQLAMMPRSGDVADLEQDVKQMQDMLQGFLDFARGASDENVVKSSIRELITDILYDFRHSPLVIHNDCQTDIILPLKYTLFRRGLTNLILNAERFAKNLWVQVTASDKLLTILIDDDGPGIPQVAREDVMRPFFRGDSSRNLDSGNVGLGMTIARDVIVSHGGTILLDEAPQGGLRIIVKIPY